MRGITDFFFEIFTIRIIVECIRMIIECVRIIIECNALLIEQFDVNEHLTNDPAIIR